MPVITKITPQVKNKNRYNIYVDDNFAVSLSANDLVKAKVSKGDEVNEKRITKLREMSVASVLLDNVLRYLSSRPHSQAEIVAYLNRRLYKNKEAKILTKKQCKKAVGSILEYLLERRYLDDVDFANWFVKQRTMSKKPRGRRAIESELYKKGVNADIIRQSLDDISDEDELKQIQVLIPNVVKRAKRRNLSGFKLRQYVANYLKNKGYNWNVILNAVDSISSQPYNNQ